MPAETAATPNPCRNPLGEACGPSSRAAAITSCTARQPVIRLQSQTADPVYEVERVQQGRGRGHAAVDPGPALLEALEGEHAGREVDPVGGERQRLGEAAASIG